MLCANESLTSSNLTCFFCDPIPKLSRHSQWVTIAQEYNKIKGTKLTYQNLAKKLANMKQKDRQKLLVDKSKKTVINRVIVEDPKTEVKVESFGPLTFQTRDRLYLFPYCIIFCLRERDYDSFHSHQFANESFTASPKIVLKWVDEVFVLVLVHWLRPSCRAIV